MGLVESRDDALEDVGVGGVGDDVWWGILRYRLVFASQLSSSVTISLIFAKGRVIYSIVGSSASHGKGWRTEDVVWSIWPQRLPPC